MANDTTFDDEYIKESAARAEKSKQKLLKQINIEIYKRNDTAIWKI